MSTKPEIEQTSATPCSRCDGPGGVGRLHYRYPLVLIQWDDSFGGGGWVDKEDLDNHVAKCETAGFVIAETVDSITITSSMTQGGEGQFLGPITIPKQSITFRRGLA